MSVKIDDIAADIKAARVEAALTQRELGERVGLPQSHISKIESGAVDLQLSSLIEIARALGLELKLVPRKTLPAINGVVRSHQERSDTSRALTIIAESSQFAEKFRASYPDIVATSDFQNALASIQTVQFNPATLKALRDALQPLQDFQDKWQNLEAESGLLRIQNHFREIARSLQHIRDVQAHEGPSKSAPRPAYRIDEDDA
ncbi:helix-turn-helix transcriptional regulator [uncultured Erythrobacter sp.]|uniref:helix-turn-helix domain-containing protein n=1 Tax=uncultured Erythrobacter sp. TaxID=263913 RepID=UPI00261C17F6|nr:helix-turn-helix transcriptional regulator [uncultured Erythrobacter sp.]